MNKFWLLVPPLLIFVAEVVLSLPTVSTHLGIGDQSWQFGLGAGLITLFFASQWITVVKPYERFQRFDATKMNILDQQTAPLLQTYKETTSHDLRVNVMLARRKAFSRREPRHGNRDKRRFCFFKKHLTPYWVSSDMVHHGDNDIALTVDQGVCGQAFRQAEPVVADLVEAAADDFNLNSRQLGKSADLKFVLSFPIRRIDQATLRLTPNVIGTVNIDSRSPHSERLVQDPKALEDLVDRAQALSELCSQLF